MNWIDRPWPNIATLPDALPPRYWTNLLLIRATARFTTGCSRRTRHRMNQTTKAQWAPYDSADFANVQYPYLKKVGVIDVGSNSVRLVVFDGAARSPAYFFNEKIMCALGAGMSETGRLNPEGRKRALAAIKRFQLLGEGMGTGPLSAVATAAVREAEDGPEFRDQVEA